MLYPDEYRLYVRDMIYIHSNHTEVLTETTHWHTAYSYFQNKNLIIIEKSTWARLVKIKAPDVSFQSKAP